MLRGNNIIALFCLTYFVISQVKANIDVRNSAWLLHPMVTGDVYIIDFLMGLHIKERNLDPETSLKLINNTFWYSLAENYYAASTEKYWYYFLPDENEVTWEDIRKAIDKISTIEEEQK